MKIDVNKIVTITLSGKDSIELLNLINGMVGYIESEFSVDCLDEFHDTLCEHGIFIGTLSTELDKVL